MKETESRPPEREQLPRHIGIIMDGNGRWAKARGLPREMGHKAGSKVVGEIIRHCKKIGISYVTIYAFSTENWKRPQKEVDALLDLLRQSGVHFGQVYSEPPTLNDVFLEITGKQLRD